MRCLLVGMFAATLCGGGVPLSSAFLSQRHHHPAPAQSAVFPNSHVGNPRVLHRHGHGLYAASDESSPPTPLCDLQTFLRLTDLVPTGGAAKLAIQGGECLLNGHVETRRAKKLFDGDVVTFGEEATSLDVTEQVALYGYVYKTKTKKIKPLARVDADGNKEFGGRFRSEEWRAARKQKKTERKTQNSAKRKEEELE
jgi:ribosome-associated protein